MRDMADRMRRAFRGGAAPAKPVWTPALQTQGGSAIQPAPMPRLAFSERIKNEGPSSPLLGPSKPGCPLLGAETHSLYCSYRPGQGAS